MLVGHARVPLECTMQQANVTCIRANPLTSTYTLMQVTFACCIVHSNGTRACPTSTFTLRAHVVLTLCYLRWWYIYIYIYIYMHCIYIYYMIIAAPLLSLYIVFLVTLCSIYKLHTYIYKYTLSLCAKFNWFTRHAFAAMYLLCNALPLDFPKV